MKTVLKIWLLVAIIISGLSGLLYATVQQMLRSGANDPQIQMAEDAAAALGAGEQVQSIVPVQRVDIATSLAPFMIVFDAGGNPLASSAQLDGQIPTIPSGIFAYVKQNGEDRVTWQPQPGVRIAAVVARFQGTHPGFVLAGRSLREVEIREGDLLHVDLLGWACLLIVSFLVSLLFFRKSGRSEDVKQL